MSKEIMQMALEALEGALSDDKPYIKKSVEAIGFLRQALAQPEQEPVAWMHVQGRYEEPNLYELPDEFIERGWNQYPLYTAPPKREWVGLTDEEISTIDWKHNETLHDYARAIEAKLREKNGHS